MRSWKIAALALVLLAGAGRAQEAARAVIEQAIKAHGGEERLSRNRADKVKLKGFLYAPPREEKVPFTAETVVQLPAQFKSVMEFTAAGEKHTLVHLMNGDKVTVLLDGKMEKADPAALAELRDLHLIDRAVRLVPLLREPGIVLAPLPDARVNDRPAAVVEVTMQGGKKILLYFDREVGLLVKLEHQLDDGSGKKVREERYFGDFKDVAGHRRAFKIIAYRDGRKLTETEVADVKYYEKLDDSEFTKP